MGRRTTTTTTTTTEKEAPMGTTTTTTTEAPAIVTEADLSPVPWPSHEDYVRADMKGKARMRADIQAAIEAATADIMRAVDEATAAMTSGDMEAARPAMERAAEARIGKADLEAIAARYVADKKADKAPDYRGLVAARIRVLRHAADLLESGAVVPKGTPEGWTFQPLWADLAVPVTDNEAATARTMAGAAVAGKKAAKRDLNGYLSAVAATLEPGTYKVSALARLVADYVDDGYVPGTGAVSAALESGVEGLVYRPYNKETGENAAGIVR